MQNRIQMRFPETCVFVDTTLIFWTLDLLF